MRRLIRQGLLTIFLCQASFPCFATNLLQVYQDALKNDPTYKKAAAERSSAYEALPQSLAKLGPHLSANFSDVATQLNPPPGAAIGNLNFGVQTYALTLNQPIFNFSNWIKVRQATAAVKQADALYAAALQNLMTRVADAYFNVLRAEDTLQITVAQKKLLTREWSKARQRSNVGSGTRTSVYTSRAALDTVLVQEIADQDAIYNRNEELYAITEQHYSYLTPLSREMVLVHPQPMETESWVKAAEQQNISLLAVRFASEVARENVKVQSGGHLPTVSVLGGAKRIHSGAIPSIQPEGNTDMKTIGLSVDIPIFQSGLVTSQVRQAKSDYQATVAELERVHRDVQTETRRIFNNITALISKIKADRQSIKSNESTVRSTQIGYKAGVNTLVEVLSAQKNLFDAQRQHSADQYTYLYAGLWLKQLVGTLSERDLQIVNKQLSPQPSQKR